RPRVSSKLSIGVSLHGPHLQPGKNDLESQTDLVLEQSRSISVWRVACNLRACRGPHRATSFGSARDGVEIDVSASEKGAQPGVPSRPDFGLVEKTTAPGKNYIQDPRGLPVIPLNLRSFCLATHVLIIALLP